LQQDISVESLSQRGRPKPVCSTQGPRLLLWPSRLPMVCPAAVQVLPAAGSPLQGPGRGGQEGGLPHPPAHLRAAHQLWRESNGHAHAPLPSGDPFFAARLPDPEGGGGRYLSYFSHANDVPLSGRHGGLGSGFGP